MSTRARHIIACLSIAAAAAFLYAATIHNPFVWDDKYLISENKFIADTSNISGLFSQKYFSQKIELSYRPAGTLLLFAGHALSGTSPEGYRAISIVLHIICSVMLLFFFTLVITDTGGRSSPAFAAAFAAAMLFALHPAINEAVNEATFNEDPLCLAFALAAFFFFRKWRRSGGIGSLVASLVLSALAMLSKETAVVIPAAFLLYDYFTGAPDKKALRAFAASIPFGVIGIAYLFIRFFVMKNPQENFIYHGGGFLSTFIASCRAWAEYPALIFAPVSQCADYFGMSFSKNPPYLAALYILVFAGFVLLPFALYRFSRAASFGAAWYVLFLLPVSNFIPIGVVMAERYLYPILPGMLLVVAAVAARILEKSEKNKLAVSALMLIFIAAAASLAFLSAKRNSVWKNEISFWTAACGCAPDSPAAFVNLGVAYFEDGDPRGAVSILEKAVDKASVRAPEKDRYGNLYRAHGNLGMALAASGRTDEAKEHLLEALRINPAYSQARYNLAAMLLRAGGRDNSAEAAMHIEKGLSADIGNVRARRMLVSALIGAGDTKRAAEELRLLSDIDPSNASEYIQAAKQLDSRRMGK